RLDLGRAHTSTGTRRFGLMLSAGFDAEVIHRIARLRTGDSTAKRVTRAHYVRPVGSAFWTYPHPPVSITADGTTTTACYCLIGNLPDYALALSVTPEARADDGMLDW